MSTPEGEDAPKGRFMQLVDSTIARPIAAMEEVGSYVTLAAKFFGWLFRPPFRLGPFIAALSFIGAESTFIVGLVGLFTGMAFTVSVIIGFRQFSAENLVGGVVAIALARELAPVLAAVVVTARAGSTMASELGNMRVTEQIDAITTMGISPVQYLVVPRILATTAMLPLLALAFGLAGMGGSYVVAVLGQNLDPGLFWDKVQSFLKPSDVRMTLIKATLFGFIVSTICCTKGFYASGGARGVGEATAKAVVASIVAIFAADYVTTLMLSEL